MAGVGIVGRNHLGVLLKWVAGPNWEEGQAPSCSVPSGP